MKKYIHYNGRKIFYSERGTGVPVILIHGYLESSEIWDGFAHKLARNFRVISVDLPGHGLSDIFSESHTMDFMAGALKGLLDKLGIEKTFLTGHSLGGYVALAFLELFPSRLFGYCLFHSHPFADSSETIQKREREIRVLLAGKKFLIYPDNVKRMYAGKNLEKFSRALDKSRELASRISAEGIIAVLKGMIARSSRLSIMEQGIVPCLWILGSMDNYIPCEIMQNTVKLPSNAELVILEESGHIGFIEEETRSVEVLTSFIDKLKK